MPTVPLVVALNRVEGDLEVRVELEDGVVSKAWCSGVMFRGFERIMEGRAALDGLVITPRICGICSTSHLVAACRALEHIADANPPPDAVRIRNIAALTETIQSDVRQCFLSFCPDLANAAHSDKHLYAEAVRRHEPFRGTTWLEAVRETKTVLEIIAILGGQWPHSSFMVPGGVTAVRSSSDLLQCRMLLERYKNWFEKCVLGGSLERWSELHSLADFEAWLDESPLHASSEVGFLWRYGSAIGLDRSGVGPKTFLSFGAFDIPADTSADALPACGKRGVVSNHALQELDHRRIREHVAASWFQDTPGGLHPFDEQTRPYATGSETGKYSWAKAPRYDGAIAETGPLAQAMIDHDPLFVDLAGHGSNALVRQLARMVRPAKLIPLMLKWLQELSRSNSDLYQPPGKIVDGEGVGLIDASRGALGHWVKIESGTIRHYQIITPTGWNASPRDSDGIAGPMEQALIGTPVPDPDDPVLIGHVVRSFDPCLVCTVHSIDASGVRRRTRFGDGP